MLVDQQSAANESTNDNSAVIIFLSQLLITVICGHIIHKTRYKYATEGSIALLVGLLTGGAAFAYAGWRKEALPGRLFEFNTDVFFNLLLPPIIFNAGFSVKKKLFFANCITVALFGILGTFVSWAIISFGAYYALQWMQPDAPDAFQNAVALGTILSSTDSVATLQVLKPDAYPILHSLVFGEGVVNDATSLVLLRALDKLRSWKQLSREGLRMLLLRFSSLFVLSLLLGVGVGLLSARLVRRLFTAAHSTDSEVLVVFGMGFLAYSVGEALDLSGIFTVFFAGITMSHYTWHSLSPSAKVVTVYMFRILSFGVELFLFIYCGFDVWSVAQVTAYTKVWVLRQGAQLSCTLLMLVMVGRAAFVFPLTLLANTWRKSKVSWRQALVIWWAGTMRGAISIALTYHHFHEKPLHVQTPEHRVIELACVVVVLATTLVLGAFTKPFLQATLPPNSINLNPPETPMEAVQVPLLLQSGDASELGGRDSGLAALWRKLDNDFLKPMFGGRSYVLRAPEPPGDVRVYPVTASPSARSFNGAIVSPFAAMTEVAAAAVGYSSVSPTSLSAAAAGGAPLQLGEPGAAGIGATLALAGPGVSFGWFDRAQQLAFAAALGSLDLDHTTEVAAAAAARSTQLRNQRRLADGSTVSIPSIPEEYEGYENGNGAPAPGDYASPDPEEGGAGDEGI